MKKFLLFIILFMMFIGTYAQSFDAISYQAVARNTQGQVLANTNVALKISILQGSTTGTVVYSENHKVTTNQFGLFTLKIGKGTPAIGTFNLIDWGNGSHFTKIEIDIAGGSNYVEVGISEMLTVPYANLAEKVKNETDPLFKQHIANTITEQNLTNWNLANSWGNHKGLYKPIDYVPVWNDISGKPTKLTDFTNDLPSISGDWADIKNKPVFSTVATSGSYNDLTNKPVLFDGTYDKLLGKPILANVAISGSYNDLKDKPTIFDGKWTSISGRPEIFTSSNYNTFLGVNAGIKTTGFPNTFIGAMSGSGNLTGNKNVFVGDSTGGKNTASWNTFVGSGSGRNNSTGSDNSFFGSSSGAQNTTGHDNAFFGFSGVSNLTGSWNSFFGSFSGSSNTIGNENVFLGYGSGRSNKTGNQNTYIGTSSGMKNEVGTGNVFIGYTAGLNEMGSNKLYISNTPTSLPLIYGEFDNKKVTINAKTTIKDIVKLQPRTTAPTDPEKGDIYFDNARSNIRFFNGTTWIDLGGTVSSAAIPTVLTGDITGITTTTATVEGNATSSGGDSIITKGICWGLTNQPTIADNKTSNGIGRGAFTANLTNLQPNTRYYVRAYATNGIGTSYGASRSIQTLALGGAVLFNNSKTYGSVSDKEGNVYKTIAIGDQTWMAENLKATKFNDGTNIANLTDEIAWGASTSPAYCWYNNINTNKAVYGALYNYYVINPETNGNKNVCPTGWHVPSSAEWDKLSNTLGGQAIAGGKLKETGTNHWLSPNSTANNESGFSAVPNGFKNNNGYFYNMNYYTYYWTANQTNTTNAEQISLYYAYSSLNKWDAPMAFGFGIRCLKDDQSVSNLPKVRTSIPTNITSTSASCGGFVLSDGGSAITARGICWGTNQNPTIADSKISSGTGTGAFTGNMTNLVKGTKYYVRAYTTNANGTTYGDQVIVEYVSWGILGTATAGGWDNDQDLTYNSIAKTWSITLDLKAGEYKFRKNDAWDENLGGGSGNGLLVSYGENIPLTIAGNYTITINVINLTYTIRLNYLPLTVKTNNAYNISSSSAVCSINVTGGNLPIIEQGICWATNTNLTTNNSKVSNPSATIFTLSGLSPKTVYYARAYVITSAGTVYGNEITLTTLGNAPTATTGSASSVLSTSATLNALVNANEVATTVTFEYGQTTSYGQTISVSSPVTGSSSTNVSAILTGLTVGTTYHYRVKAVNSLGTTYGSDVIFTAVYAIGEKALGGIIFHLDNTSLHGLVCSLEDQSTSAIWGCSGTSITGADGTSIGTGIQNTSDIVSGCATSGIAADICANLVLNNYSDWYLPSDEEFSLIKINLISKGLGNFSVGLYGYWSSSEISTTNAWYWDMLNLDSGHYSISKTRSCHVRAVRSF